MKGNTISFNSFINGNCRGGGLIVLNSDLYEQPAKVTIQGNRFEGNEGSRGGALRTERNPGCVVSENEFINNIATDLGGGIANWNSNPFTLTNNIFIQNRATNSAGGLSCWDSEVLIANNIFCENKSRWGGGVVIAQNEPAATFVAQIINNTITANVADSAGGIGTWYMKNVISLNNICWGNDAPFAPEILVHGGEINVTHSDIKGGVANIVTEEAGRVNWLAGNIDADPKFVDNSLKLDNSSPCIGAGIDSLQISGDWYFSSQTDYNGHTRPDPPGSSPDIGAWESPLATEVINFAKTEIPQNYFLGQNYPNPFNLATTIEFALPKPAFVTLKVYNLLGEEVAILIAEQRSAGIHKLNWDVRGLASGVYLYRLEAGDYVQSKKLILMR